jgi:hypothetical protein
MDVGPNLLLDLLAKLGEKLPLSFALLFRKRLVSLLEQR